MVRRCRTGAASVEDRVVHPTSEGAGSERLRTHLAEPGWTKNRFALKDTDQVPRHDGTQGHGDQRRGTEPAATAVYALGSNAAESARLQRQSDELRPLSAELLERVDLRPGQSAIDLGCGPSGIIQLLFERVSPGGRVVGVDADPVHVTMARAFR